MKLFKGYFNYGIRFKLLKNKKKRKNQIRPLPMRYRLLSTKKAFVGKGDLKHTNNKVIITFYLYNAQEMFISDNFNRVKALLLNKSLNSSPLGTSPQGTTLRREGTNEQNEKIILYNRMFNPLMSGYEFLALDEHYEAYYNQMGSIIKKRNIVFANINYLFAIYIYILKTKLFNDPLNNNSSLPEESKIFSKINYLVNEGIYNNLLKTSAGEGTKGLKDNLLNNLFKRFFNLRLAKYRLSVKLKSKPYPETYRGIPSGDLPVGDLVAPYGDFKFLNRPQKSPLGGRVLQKTNNNFITFGNNSRIFNFEYYLYKMSLSYLEKVFLY